MGNSNKKEVREEKLLKLVEEALRLNEELFVHEIEKRLKSVPRASLDNVDSNSPTEESDSSEQWTGVESMSRLRGIVGGRFQNLKERWLSAGLPLKEHRGSKTRSYKIEKDGWIELSSWISQQGYEVRLASEEDDYLFFVRPLKS